MSEPSATRMVCITNSRGLHARPAELFARLAMEFKSKIEIIKKKDGQRVDGRSILHVLTLGAECGTELVLEACGEDAEAALDALAGLVGSGFGAYEKNET